MQGWILALLVKSVSEACSFILILQQFPSVTERKEKKDPGFSDLKKKLKLFDILLGNIYSII